ncbi:MAG: alginate lyase family protein [Sedimentisphaerales bacterium]|nr:alginate lyase family protein [Sedimentisphaerales bacterium]HNY78476.1 alginate lyase family protein [Sedimentisphaerales bacterium]HOC63676.1 alginate lyase family protein [Sedimentisphaerales bacterium]HOH64385.1 alginate lyase family protein [Sedimentisphaerales bacterium]HQA91287.1 alginate lyase family protein [Sedimentisphaerales bacterium]
MSEQHTCVRFLRRPCLAFSLVLTALLTGAAAAGRGSDLQVILPDVKHPYLACTAEELDRLRQARRGPEVIRDGVVSVPTSVGIEIGIKEAEGFIGEPIRFPPRGGQHNQWYQCDQCETALQTIDETHHQCPRCRKVYSGHPYDDVIFSRRHGRNLQRMETAAWAYAICGREEFAKYAARVLLGYADRYRAYPYHSASLKTDDSWGNKAGGHLYEQTLTEASALATSIGPAYDLIYDSGVLSAEDHHKIAEGLLLPMLNTIDRNKAGKSNWQTWHNAAMMWGGALLRDADWIRKAIADPENGFYHQMDVSVSREGMWYENSWGYHFYTLRALVITAETARRLGIDLWGDERLKRMFTLPIEYTMADGMLPRFGDDVNSSVKSVSVLYEPAYHAYRDPRILAMLPGEPGSDGLLLGRQAGNVADGPVLQSKVFEDAGHAILRAGGPAGLTAAMTFGPYGGFHGHFDKLSFVLYGYGKELGVDPGRARSQAYRLPIHGHWYKATIGHNAVLVNGRSQAPATGKLALFERADGYVAAGAACEAAYPGVKHERLLVMTETYLLVLDRLHADRDRRFDWLYHSRGARVVCGAAVENADRRDDCPGSEYIQNMMQGTTDAMIRVVFEDAAVPTYLTLAAQQGTIVAVGDGVGGSVTDRVPMVMIGREGRDTNYAAVLEPVPASGRPTVTGVQLGEEDGRLDVIVEQGSSQDRIRIDLDTGLTVRLSR